MRINYLAILDFNPLALGNLVAYELMEPGNADSSSAAVVIIIIITDVKEEVPIVEDADAC